MSRKNGVTGPAAKYTTNGTFDSHDDPLDEISLETGSDARNQKRDSQSKGPWANSSQNYSRSVDRHETGMGKEKGRSNRFYMCFCLICVLVFIVGLGLGIVIGRFAVKDESEPTNDHLPPGQDKLTTTAVPPTSQPTCNCQTSPGTCLVCESRDPDLSNGDETEQSLFAAMTSTEINKITKAIQSRELVIAGQGLNSNRASHIYLYPVNKAEALDYLDNGGSFPGRYAYVHVIRGLNNDIIEYKIGPLHEAEENMTVTQLVADGKINFNRRPYDRTEVGILRGIVNSHFKTLNPIFQESFSGAILGNGVYFSIVSLPTEYVSNRTSKAYLYLQTSDFYTLRVLPVTCLIHHPGTDTSVWTVSDFYYLSQGPFSTSQDLLNAYNNNQLRKFAFPDNFLQNKADFSITKTFPFRDGTQYAPPRSFEPAGSRYTITGNRIKWLGWEFEFTSDPQRGPAIFDVRFQGQRIAYEISLQDVTLIYSSQTNGAGPPVLTDTHFQLGTYSTPRIGVDCPKRSSFLASTKYFYGRVDSKFGTCVFEADGDIALWRHATRGLADNYLIVRSTMLLGNYDYTLEWKFHLDGHLDTQISASGYLYGAFWDPNDPLVNEFKSSTPFGYRLSDYLLGPIHDHSFSFKVDLDILGTNNSLETLHWKGGSPLDALRTQTNVNTSPGYFYLNTTRYIQYDTVKKERGFKLDPMNPKYWTVVNENETNAWGVKRGYRIIPKSTSGEHMTDHVMFQAWEHMKHNIVVTKRKDSEPFATDSLYDLTHPGASFRGVGKMLDNEDVRNEDLVLWVTEKFLHAPSSEDVPMTLQIHKGFSLKPFNYFDRTQTFDVPGHYNMNEPYDQTPCVENL